MKAAWCLLCFFPVVAAAYREGPEPGHTGGFDEPTCQKCHFDHPLNDPGGSLTIEGVPERYTPGVTYPLTIRVARPTARRGGFQLSARFAGGTGIGMPAGRLAVREPHAQVVAGENGVHYAEQTDRGSEATAGGTLTWTLEWAAPSDAAGPVAFHAAANLANGDDSPLGDHIYTSEIRTEAER